MAELRNLIEQRVNVQWNDWAERHPELARAIDRVQLVEVSIDRLSDDIQYREALQQSGLDEAQLVAAAKVLDVVERVVGRVLPL